MATPIPKQCNDKVKEMVCIEQGRFSHLVKQ